MTDREYFHVAKRPHAPRRAWHAADGASDSLPVGLCGFTPSHGPVEWADRLPPTAHFCGNCSRSVAARTDQEVPERVESDFEPFGSAHEGAPV